jgi:hypothetical protein
VSSSLGRVVIATLCFGVWAGAGGAARGAEPGGEVRGHVQTANGQTVATATVTLEGASHLTTTSDNGGAFAFSGLTAGTYALQIAKPGFESLTRNDVLVLVGERTTIDAVLTPSSFSSLQTIGRVTSGSGKIAINTSGAALNVISAQTFFDQGAVQVTGVLEQTPGVTMTTSAGAGNHASLAAPEVPQLRGALSYETESLIDGHPVSVGGNGSFSPLLVMPALLQNVEVAKGPGAMPVEINYAIGGSVNYRTLEPTRKFQLSFDAGVDRYGGTTTAIRATGSTANHKLEFAVAFATDGTPGPLHDYPVAGSQVVLAYGNQPWLVNGQQIAGIPVFPVAGNTPQYAGTIGVARWADPLYICCSLMNTAYDARAELGKLRFNFSEQTALTMSYIGGQASDNLTGAHLGSLVPLVNFSTFAPPAGYTGTVAPGTSIPFDNQANTNQTEVQLQSLFQAELRTALGGTTLLARAYSGYANDQGFGFPLAPTFSVTQNAWGGIALCPLGTTGTGTGKCVVSGGGTVAPTVTYFNGQPVTLTTTAPGSYALIVDHVRGFSLEADRQVGQSLLTLAFDRSNHDSWEYENNPSVAINQYVLPPGSGQQFTTVLARVQAELAPRLSATLANYLTSYASHYTGNGVTWSDATHWFNAPRLAFSWRPTTDVAWRFALGASIAPPYINLLSAQGGTPVSNAGGGATAYTVNANNGEVAPEKAFGYDVGIDLRLAPRLRVSSDVYLTNVRDLFLNVTTQNGTYTPSAGADKGNTEPLYITQTGNVGHARYEGVEFDVALAPLSGIGFKLQGSLERAFVYDLSPAFYTTAAGPNTANLGVLPNINFQPSGMGFNGISNGRIPYSSGYFEVNERTPRGIYLRAGFTYFGPNNQYNQPAFGVLSASVRVPFSARDWLQLSGDNLTNIYGAPFEAQFGGVPVPLVNGKLGIVDGPNVGPPMFRLDYHHAFGALR